MLKKLRLKLICFMMALISVTLCMIFLLLLHFTRINLEKESMLMMQKAGAIPSPLEWSLFYSPDQSHGGDHGIRKQHL